jgi:hypothetical protein
MQSFVPSTTLEMFTEALGAESAAAAGKSTFGDYLSNVVVPKVEAVGAKVKSVGKRLGDFGEVMSMSSSEASDTPQNMGRPMPPVTTRYQSMILGEDEDLSRL